MQNNTTHAEAMTAKDRRTQELLSIIYNLRESLNECFDFVQDVEFDRPSHKTANILGRAEEAIFQADFALKK